MSETIKDDIAKALLHTLQSPNVSDSNFEAANVVDAIDSVARAINRLAVAVGQLADQNPGG